MARLHGKDKGILEYPKGSGKWWVRIYKDGREKRFRADNKTQAKALYGRLKADIREKRYFPEKYEYKPTYLKPYMAEAITANTKLTIREDRRYARFWDSQFPSRTLDSITSGEIEKVRRGIVDDGRSPATANRYLAFLRTTYYRAVRDKKSKENPVAQIRFYKESAGRLRFISEDEERRLFEAISPIHWPKVLFALSTGLRQAEQFKLRWEQIDIENKVLTIPRSKSGEVRHVPLSDDVLSILRGFSSWMVSP